MSLSELGEFGIIALFREAAAAEGGIGDDCAVLDLGEERLLVTTDLLLEHIHFRRGDLTPWQLGWKAMAVNVSDVAAMGATPWVAFLGLGLAGHEDAAWVRAFRDGILDCARAFGVALMGGDTVRSAAHQVVGLTLLGRTRDPPLLRSGARPGDQVYLGGPVGASAAGLELLMNPRISVPDGVRSTLLRAHLEPQPQVALGRFLASQGLSRCAIDVSDGVLQDLGHLCEESGVGAWVDAGALPIPPEARALPGDPVERALGGGEDYVLLFTSPCPDVAERCASEAGILVHAIGAVTAEPGLFLHRDGSRARVTPRGYDAFAP